MKQIIKIQIALLFSCFGIFIQCSVFKNSNSNSNPTIITKVDTIRVTQIVQVPYSVHDTLTKDSIVERTVFQPVLVGFPIDTTRHRIYITPQKTDTASWTAAQGAINYRQTHPGYSIELTAGNYYLPFPLMAAVINSDGTDFDQAFLDIRGPVRARNTPANQTANLIAEFDDMPLFILQKCKGCTIENLTLTGQYTKSYSFDYLSIDTLHFDQWKDNHCAANRTRVHAAIDIDPFSQLSFYDSITYQIYPKLKNFYLPEMDRSGSTDILIDNCLIQQFVVGILVSGGMQQNGELIHMEKNSIQGCISAIVQTQAQSKTNTVKDGMTWGAVHTIIDCAHWGFRRGDAVCFPWVDGYNVAGYNYQFTCGTPINFTTTFQRVYAESIFRLCDFGGFPKAYPGNGPTLTRSGVVWRDCIVDFQTQQIGIPSPDFHVNCAGCVFDGCLLRIYNNTPAETGRILFSDEGAMFRDGVLGAWPIAQRTDPTYNMPTSFDNVRLYSARWAFLNSRVNAPEWETQINTGYQTFYIDRKKFNGYFISRSASLFNLFSLYDNLIAQDTVFETISPGAWTPNKLVGIINQIRGDTVFFQNAGLYHTGDSVQLFIDRSNH